MSAPAPSAGERLQRVVDDFGDRRSDIAARRRAVAVASSVVALALDCIVHDRALFEHAIDTAGLWCAEAVGADALAAARGDVARAASRADADDDRGAWCAMEAVVGLLDLALEPVHIVAAKRARELGHRVAEALAWPDVDVDEVVDAVDARLRAAIDVARERHRAR